MRRREFLGVLGVAATWPIVTQGQQPAMPVIGFLSSRSPGESAAVVAAFREGLREIGFVEGDNVVIAFRWAEGRYDRLPTLAAELVGLRVAALLVAGGSPAAVAAKAATSTIPIVVSSANELVRQGLVASLNRPGGNITGMSAFNAALSAKRLELVHEMLPAAGRFAYLVNPSNPSIDIETNGALTAAATLGLKLDIINASSESELAAAFAAATSLGARAFIVSGDPYFDSQRERLVALAAEHAMPSNYAWREYVMAGGLMSYGNSLPDAYRQAGIYVGRILKGEKPGDLPVMQPSKFHLALNLKTAKSLGIQFPPTLLARADEVIE